MHTVIIMLLSEVFRLQNMKLINEKKNLTINAHCNDNAAV